MKTTENDVNKLMLELHDLNIKYIYVKYSGGGDDGAIDDIKAVYEFDKMNSKDWNWKTDAISDFSEDGKLTSELPNNFVDKIDNLLTDIILNDIEDWYNNDGGYGHIVIAVPSADYIVENNIQYTSFETYEHECNLIEKSINL